MNIHLENIKKLLENSTLSESEKQSLLKAVTDADKQWAITDFKLDRTEKVKKTTAILLEETIEELEQKRKAVEAQNRELEIETSLERVRTVAMGMLKADDLLKICEVQFNELKQLGFTGIRNALIGIFNDEQQYYLDYDYSDFSGGNIHKIPYYQNAVVDKAIERMKTASDAFTEFIVEGQALDDWKSFRKNNGEYEDTRIEDADALYYYFYSINLGNLGISTFKKINEEQLNILKRFRNVFDLAYKRYVDISHAAALAREAQIETGLERVRSRSLAMHNTSELQEVIHTVHKELLHLNIAINGGSFISINSDIHTQLRCWGSGGTADTSEEVLLPLYEKPFCSNLIKEIKKGPGFFTEAYSQEEKKEFFTFLFKHEPWLKLDAKQKEETLLSPGGYARSCIVSEHTTIFIINHFGEKFSAADNDILKRFGKVFEQTYTRFLDLQKAEAQAKEAQIEAALERVRSRSLAMQKSEELKEVIQVVYEQFVHLNVNTEHTGFVIDYKERDDRVIWVASKHGVPSQLTIPYFDCEYYNSFNAAKNKGLDFFATNLNFEDKNSFYRQLFKYIPDLPDDAKAFYFNCRGLAISTVLLDNVALYIENFEGASYSDEDNVILMRFGKVFQQTYTRFLDLQKAEAQARESQIEAALERVRSRTLAMQKSDELAETASELFKQLMVLGIEPNRLYIGIVNAGTKEMEMWATDEEGIRVGKKFSFFAADNDSVGKLYDGWLHKKKSVVVVMEGEELDNYIAYLQQLQIPLTHALTQKRRVQSVAFFDKGFIGMASPDDQSIESIQLLERFATVFNLTYTRFNDLKVAEAHAEQAVLDLIKLQTEKKRAEDALGELRATQTQLIQSEKMASLGELTAGIAHEIQNPLNFVNNFSEVSNELIDEMMEEVVKGNYEEVRAIADDVKQNLEKINHHGKRADGIVKGMLQHSRSSSATKEPTDINKLADEYLRLAYHGLRAKDKSFNATLKTDYDETLQKVNIVPQDIGRVVLNLITNAFYAAPLPPEGGFSDPDYVHSPTIWVSTKKEGNKVLIAVRDNGPGIPKNIIDKIFQPFFTTKPTGQGTGLGLSLAYDIVKAHGGELKVETKDGEGTTFIIELNTL